MTEKIFPEKNAEEYKFNEVQAFISTIAFPSELDDLKYYWIDLGRFDIEDLLKDTTNIWSVPKWAKRWDIMFFMHTKTSIDRIHNLRNKLEKNKDVYDVRDYNQLKNALKYGENLYDMYGGKIFAIGMVQGNILPKQKGDTRYYAKISRVFKLDYPLHYDDFKNIVNISQSVTPVYGSKFQKLQRMISEKNELPDYVKRSESVPIRGRLINRYNWIRVQRKFKYRFILESQFRSGFVDYLLKEIGDSRKIFEECEAYQSGMLSGYIDNVIKFRGSFLPVEVKLNIKAENDLVGQVRKYCRLSNLILDKKKSIYADLNHTDSNHVLIIDTFGLYLYDNDKDMIDGLYDLSLLKSFEELDGIKAVLADRLGLLSHDERGKMKAVYENGKEKFNEWDRSLIENSDIEDVYRMIDEMEMPNISKRIDDFYEKA